MLDDLAYLVVGPHTADSCRCQDQHGIYDTALIQDTRGIHDLFGFSEAHCVEQSEALMNHECFGSLYLVRKWRRAELREFQGVEHSTYLEDGPDSARSVYLGIGHGDQRPLIIATKSL